jgi:hypothetical protein
VTHPYVFALAVVACLPIIPSLARYFFESWAQFLEDNYLLDNDERKFNVVFGALFGSMIAKPSLNLNLILFLVVVAACMATVYHLLVFALEWLS